VTIFRGKINYYTHPPEKSESQVSSEIVTQMGKEFDMDSLLSDQQKIIDSKYLLKPGFVT
jgi:hypothetical protein